MARDYEIASEMSANMIDQWKIFVSLDIPERLKINSKYLILANKLQNKLKF